MPDRVVVFVDWQNLYHGAKRAFFGGRGKGTDGQVWPDQIADIICAKKPPGGNRTVEQVRVYRGVASAEEDLVANAAARQQIAAWERYPHVDVFPHTLKRMTSRCPECGVVSERLGEKGVDVNLATDLIDLAHERHYDIGVVVSTDTDFEPAIMLAEELGVRVENALWWTGERRKDHPLLRGEIWHHRLNFEDYRIAQDRRLYVPSWALEAAEREQAE